MAENDLQSNKNIGFQNTQNDMLTDMADINSLVDGFSFSVGFSNTALLLLAGTVVAAFYLIRRK